MGCGVWENSSVQSSSRCLTFTNAGSMEMDEFPGNGSLDVIPDGKEATTYIVTFIFFGKLIIESFSFTTILPE